MTTSNTAPSVSRRTALAALGAGGLGLAFSSFSRGAAAQEAASAAVTSVLDVVYGEIDGQPVLLDVALPPDRAYPRPAVILLHGGGLAFGDKAGLLAPLTTELAQAGYVTFNLNYRLFGEDGSNAWPAQLDDVQRAVRWVRTNAATYGVDPDRVAAFGHSSGAQLAAFLGTRETRDDADPTLAGVSSRVTCVVDIAGPMDLTIPYANAENNALNAAILGGTATTPPDAAAYRDFSPITFVDGPTVPFLIQHGLADVDCPLEQSRLMTAALQGAGVEVFTAEYAGFSHMAIIDWTVIGPVTLAFLGRQLQPEV
jgi:acetyl esterase/lipase